MTEKEKRIIEKGLQKIRENKTTRKQAKKIIKLVFWVDPYQICLCDVPDFIKSMCSNSLSNEIENLVQFIKDCFDVSEIKSDIKLLKMFKNIFLLDARKKDTINNYCNYDLYIKYYNKLLKD